MTNDKFYRAKQIKELVKATAKDIAKLKKILTGKFAGERVIINDNLFLFDEVSRDYIFKYLIERYESRLAELKNEFANL